MYDEDDRVGRLAEVLAQEKLADGNNFANFGTKQATVKTSHPIM